VAPPRCGGPTDDIQREKKIGMEGKGIPRREENDDDIHSYILAPHVHPIPTTSNQLKHTPHPTRYNSGWDMRHEKQAVAHYAAAFAPQDSLAAFLPTVTRRLQALTADPVAYDPMRLPEVNRQKLQRRLWAGLKREAARFPEGGPLRAAMVREKGFKVRTVRLGVWGGWMGWWCVGCVLGGWVCGLDGWCVCVVFWVWMGTA
jgi:hypothetical protein